MSHDLEDDLPDGCVVVPPWVDQVPSYFDFPAFWTVTPALFKKESLELSPYQADISRILEANSVKDITALEDASLLDALVRVISVGSPGAGGVLTAQGHVWNPPVQETTTGATIDPSRYTLTNGPVFSVSGHAEGVRPPLSFHEKSFIEAPADHQNERPSPRKKGKR
jgi:hypothetical protein